MLKNRFFLLLLIFAFLAFCSCEKFDFNNYHNGDIISNSIDGNLYKLNSEFVMFDDTGALKDDIVRINLSDKDSYEYASDYYNDGTQYYKAIFEKVYCNEEYIIITLKENKKVIVIDCKEKSKKKAIQSYNSIVDIKFIFSDYKRINCSYY